MKSVLFCILCLTISYACTSKNQNSHSEAPVAQLHSAKKSKLDIGPLKLEIIPLEKTEESLLAGVHHAHIDKENDRIIVLSSFNLYYFDGKGRFVTKLVYAFEFKGFYFVGLDDKKGNCYAIEKSKVNNVFSNGPIFSYLGLPEVESLRIPVGKQKEGLILSCNLSDFFDDLNEATKTIELGGASLQVNANDNPIIITLQ